MPQKILLDTNFLMIPFQLKVDIFSEIDRLCNFKYDLYMLDKSLDELATITKRKGRQKDEAKLALVLAKAKGIKIIKSEKKGHTDDIIAEMQDFIVATRDLPLMSRLRKKGMKVITLRQKSHLILL